MPPSRSPAATEGATRAAEAATPGTARRLKPMIAVRIVVWVTISMGVLVKLSQHRKGGREVFVSSTALRRAHFDYYTPGHFIGTVRAQDCIGDFGMVSEMLRDCEPGEEKSCLE